MTHKVTCQASTYVDLPTFGRPTIAVWSFILSFGCRHLWLAIYFQFTRDVFYQEQHTVVREYLLDDALARPADDWVKEERETNATVALAASMMERTSLIGHYMKGIVSGWESCDCVVET